MTTALLTTAEAAEELGLSQVRVTQFCQQGRLGRKVGRGWIITRAELRKFRELERPAHRPAKHRRKSVSNDTK